MDALELSGRILFLVDDYEAVRAQLASMNLPYPGRARLRNEISTDEITPLATLVHFDATLGRYAHTGFKAGDGLPIGEGAIQTGGFSVLVGGARYGKGSSREHSPVAEQAAGIKLVIAESFERIYRQNCDNIGLFTSTDFSLIDRIQAGEAIPIDLLTAGRDTLGAAILKAGGLLSYGMQYLKHLPSESRRDSAAAPNHPKPASQKNAVDDPLQPQTLAEKIIARHRLNVPGLAWNMKPGTGGFVRPELRFIHEIYTGMAAHMLQARFGDEAPLFDPASILLFEDHNSYAHRSPTHLRLNLLDGIRRLSQAHREFGSHYHLKNHGYLPDEEGSEGISHSMMAELYSLPGQLIVGTDSHTPHSGALGCLAVGVGTTDMANAFVTGACRITAGETFLFRLEGSLAEGINAKDVMLHLLALPEIRAGACLGKVVEFAGPVIEAMTTDERATLTNMTAELGGLTGIVAPDAETVRFIKERRGVDIRLEDWMRSDPGAAYAKVLAVDCTAIGPMLAAPGDPGRGMSVAGLPHNVRVNIAYGGSCTAGKRADFDAYHKVLRWAADHGLKVADGVTLYLQCGSVQVRDYCIAKGYLDTFREVGAELLQPACGACGQCGPGVSTEAGQVTISAINRNFPGRGGPGSVWLASPATVAASAIAGEITSFEKLQAEFAAAR